jgi:hypothetical protein
MTASHADMPPELPLPLPLSAAYHHLVLRIIDFDVFLKGNFLVYIIRLPLTNSMLQFIPCVATANTIEEHSLNSYFYCLNVNTF